MITPAQVQASVVDIRAATARMPRQLVTDANILYWLFYPNFSSLQYAGGRQPKPYQVTHYPAYWKRAGAAGTTFHIAVETVGEFTKSAEYAEWETIWLTDSSTPQPDPANPVTQFDPRICKFARYHDAGQVPMVRKAVEVMVSSLRKTVNVLPQFSIPDALLTESLKEWQGPSGDFADSTMVAVAKQAGITEILSDDMDFATFGGITLYTANQKTISAAGTAGKLL